MMALSPDFRHGLEKVHYFRDGKGLPAGQHFGRLAEKLVEHESFS
jgi:hypothetical protein